MVPVLTSFLLTLFSFSDIKVRVLALLLHSLRISCTPSFELLRWTSSQPRLCFRCWFWTCLLLSQCSRRWGMKTSQFFWCPLLYYSHLDKNCGSRNGGIIKGPMILRLSRGSLFLSAPRRRNNLVCGFCSMCQLTAPTWLKWAFFGTPSLAELEAWFSRLRHWGNFVPVLYLLIIRIRLDLKEILVVEFEPWRNDVIPKNLSIKLKKINITPILLRKMPLTQSLLLCLFLRLLYIHIYRLLFFILGRIW